MTIKTIDIDISWSDDTTKQELNQVLADGYTVIASNIYTYDGEVGERWTLYKADATGTWAKLDEIALTELNQEMEQVKAYLDKYNLGKPGSDMITELLQDAIHLRTRVVSLSHTAKVYAEKISELQDKIADKDNA